MADSTDKTMSQARSSALQSSSRDDGEACGGWAHACGWGWGVVVSSSDKRKVFGNTFDEALEHNWLPQAIIKL